MAETESKSESETKATKGVEVETGPAFAPLEGDVQQPVPAPGEKQPPADDAALYRPDKVVNIGQDEIEQQRAENGHEGQLGEYPVK